MKPNPICITKQKLLFENEREREREREREIEKKGTGEIPYTNLCCVFLLCFMLLSLSVPLFFVPSMSLLCVYLLSFSVFAFFFLPSVLALFCLLKALYLQRSLRNCSLLFLFLNLPVNGQFHGPLSFLRAHAIPHSSAFWFVLFLEFSFHKYQAVHVIFSFLF